MWMTGANAVYFDIDRAAMSTAKIIAPRLINFL